MPFLFLRRMCRNNEFLLLIYGYTICTKTTIRRKQKVENWKKALPLGIINLLIFAVLAANFYVLIITWLNGNIDKVFAAVIFAAGMFFFTVFSFANCSGVGKLVKVLVYFTFVPLMVCVTVFEVIEVPSENTSLPRSAQFAALSEVCQCS